MKTTQSRCGTSSKSRTGRDQLPIADLFLELWTLSIPRGVIDSGRLGSAGRVSRSDIGSGRFDDIESIRITQHLVRLQRQLRSCTYRYKYNHHIGRILTWHSAKRECSYRSIQWIKTERARNEVNDWVLKCNRGRLQTLLLCTHDKYPLESEGHFLHRRTLLEVPKGDLTRVLKVGAIGETLASGQRYQVIAFVPIVLNVETFGENCCFCVRLAGMPNSLSCLCLYDTE